MYVLFTRLRVALRDLTVRLDVRRYEAWMERDPETVMQKCAASVRSKGWNFVRPALSVTVRYALPLP